MPVYYSHHYVIRVGWSPLHLRQPNVPEATRPDYIIPAWQTDDYHSVTSRTNKSPTLFEKYRNAIGCRDSTIMAITEPLRLLSMELILLPQ